MTMEDIMLHVLFDEQISDYEFWQNVSEWMM